MQSVSIDQLIGKDAGSYHIDRLLGQGPVSSFCEAHHASGRRVILTLFNLPETFSAQAHARFLARFQQEGAALVQLRHPAILPVYDYGECAGYPYLATPLVPGSSLAQVLQSYGRIPPEPALELLKQVADGLDYASSHGVLHGALSPANILAGKSRGEVQVAGFGLTRILALQGLEAEDAFEARLLNIAGSYLALPAYTAPEIVKGASYSASSDIYALGVLLFELLSGKRPFNGETPFDVMQQYAQQSVLSLVALVPKLPESVDAVIQKALAPFPEMRFQSAGELIQAFEQALYAQQVERQQPFASIAQNAVEKTDITGPLTIDWQAVKNATAEKRANEQAEIAQMTPEEARARMAQQATLPGLDPFAWWSNVSPTQMVSHPQVNKSTPAAQKAEGRKQTRRRVVALLTVSSAVVVAGLGGGGFALAHYLKQKQAAEQAAMAAAQPSPTVPPTPTPTPLPSPTPQPTAKPTTKAATPTPTAPPPPPPTPTPGHTGTVIASTSMAPNSAVKFNGGDDILIHLPGGSFVAYNRSCTHQQVPVDYDSGSQQLVCPAHGAVFNPASGGSVVHGPAHKPLPSVPVRVNGDGTITV
jgi:serine/threonine protein kinase